MSNPRIPKGCERCEFPSQCRYGLAERELIDDQPSSSPMTGFEYTSTFTANTKAEDGVARYYAKEDVTFESILAKAEAAGKSVQSKMMDFYTSDKELKRSKIADSKTGDKVAKTPGRQSKKPSLLSIAEEALKSELDTGLQDLAMPLVDSWVQAKEKRKSYSLTKVVASAKQAMYVDWLFPPGSPL